MSTQETLLTADEFYDFCCKNDGRYELVRGEVIELSPVNDEHSGIAVNIATAFNNYSRRYGFGQAGVEAGHIVLSEPDTVRGPDVSFRLVPRSGGRQRAGFLAGAPDIAVEVVSPSNTAAETERKVQEYVAAGSQRVWVVYPATRTSPRHVVVHHPDRTTISYTGDDVITDEGLLPGFSLPLAEVFE